jgi:hypothetical protein
MRKEVDVRQRKHRTREPRCEASLLLHLVYRDLDSARRVGKIFFAEARTCRTPLLTLLMKRER